MHRRHDIDTLRALAFALVILYHLAMYYVAGWGWHLKSPHAADWLQIPMRAVNLWRMDLVFLISGTAMAFLSRGTDRSRLLARRSLRLLLPLAFGMAVVVPFQPYAQGLANGLVEPGFGRFLVRYYGGGPWPAGAFDGWQAGVTWNHLWYLAYLWLYTAVLVLLLPLLDSTWGRRLRDAFRAMRGATLLIAPALPLVLYSLVLWPNFPPTHDLVHDAWVHAVSFTCFLYGYWIAADEALWDELARLRWKSLALAVALLAAFIACRALLPPAAGTRQLLRVLGDFYLWAAICAILGWARAHLDRPWPWLAWAKESVYPWYVLHQTVIIVLVVWIAPLRLGPVLEPVLLVAGTVGACWALTAIICRVDLLRPLFGLRRRAPSRCPSSASPARPAARSA